LFSADEDVRRRRRAAEARGRRTLQTSRRDLGDRDTTPTTRRGQGLAVPEAEEREPAVQRAAGRVQGQGDETRGEEEGSEEDGSQEGGGGGGEEEGKGRQQDAKAGRRD
jgi:hypothetical protein